LATNTGRYACSSCCTEGLNPPARSFGGHCPNLKIRLLRAARESHQAHCRKLPARPHQGRTLQDPYRADRQRHLVTSPGKSRSAAADIRLEIDDGEIFLAHAFELACAQNDIGHCLIKPRHPWTNGRVERSDRALKETTARRFHYEAHHQLQSHVTDFVNAYHCGRQLKTLRGLTPTKPSTNHGPQSMNVSHSTRSSKCRDQTALMSVSSRGRRASPVAVQALLSMQRRSGEGSGHCPER
jgi:hypothetical protein